MRRSMWGARTSTVSTAIACITARRVLCGRRFACDLSPMFRCKFRRLCEVPALRGSRVQVRVPLGHGYKFSYFLLLPKRARAWRAAGAMTCAITPPLNFAHVGPGVYRSGFPGRHNLTFLQRLGLRTLVRLEAAEYPPEVAAWIEEQGIRIVQCATTRNREPFVSMNQAVLLTALRALLDHQNHPVLVHGLRGQQRTGVVVGCLRRLQRWSLSPTFDEYRRHAATASSLLDLQQIELFDPSLRSSAPSTAEDETLAESDGAETGYQRSTI